MLKREKTSHPGTGTELLFVLVVKTMRQFGDVKDHGITPCE